MTVVAAVALADRVIMGCDTATDNDGTTIYRSDGKILVLLTGDRAERVLIGSAGNAAIRSILARDLKISTPPPDATDQEADDWAGTVAETITQVLATTTPPILARHDGGPDHLDGCLLMAWRQHLWIVYTHAALRPRGDIAAIGSGKELALGSLYTVARAGIVHPDACMSYAIELACAYDSGCGIDDRGPIVLSTLDEDQAEKE